MSAGCLIAVVGPSGVGKDSVINGIVAARPDIIRVTRVITRAAHLEGEDFHPFSAEEFEAAARGGAFCLHWQAHGLSYGIPVSTQSDVAAGRTLVVNLSRGVLAEAHDMFHRLVVLHITAQPETLAARLRQRGRETAGDLSARLAREVPVLPAFLNTFEISNDGHLEDTIRAALKTLEKAIP